MSNYVPAACILARDGVLYGQLLTCALDACRDQSVDWKTLRSSLQKARSADIPFLDASGLPQAFNQDTPASSMLQIVQGGRHDSASSNIEPRRHFVPVSPRTPKVPALGKMGTAGSLPVYSYQKPLPAPSCPVCIRTLDPIIMRFGMSIAIACPCMSWTQHLLRSNNMWQSFSA